MTSFQRTATQQKNVNVGFGQRAAHPLHRCALLSWVGALLDVDASHDHLSCLQSVHTDAFHPAVAMASTSPPQTDAFGFETQQQIILACQLRVWTSGI